MVDKTFTPKDVALRAVGRTVVNFQRLEHCLKGLARLGPVEGALSKVQRDIERRAVEASSFTLGRAIQAWIGIIASDGPSHERTDDLFEPTVRGTFRLEGDVEALNAHGEALKGLLEIRNRLIHGDLVQFDWDSREACEALVERLNGVNEAIAPQIEFLAGIGNAMQSIRPEDIEIEDSNGLVKWLPSSE